MSVRVEAVYRGDLICRAVHGPSGDAMLTDAPTDNQGQGRHFSPTDLVGTSMITCMMTIIGISARASGWSVEGMRAEVMKEMSAVPRRHIAQLVVTIRLPASVPLEARKKLEAAALGCPVKASLGPDTTVDVAFVYEEPDPA